VTSVEAALAAIEGHADLNAVIAVCMDGAL
jgi:hypothetical protein